MISDFMLWLYSDGDIVQNTMKTVTLLVALTSIFNHWRCSVSLLVFLLGYRFMDGMGVAEHYPLLMWFCCFICMAGTKPKYNELGYAVAFIYMLRMILGQFNGVGFLGSEAVFIASTLLLLPLQLILITGSFCSGYSERISSVYNRYLHNFTSVILPRKWL